MPGGAGGGEREVHNNSTFPYVTVHLISYSSTIGFSSTHDEGHFLHCFFQEELLLLFCTVKTSENFLLYENNFFQSSETYRAK